MKVKKEKGKVNSLVAKTGMTVFQNREIANLRILPTKSLNPVRLLSSHHCWR